MGGGLELALACDIRIMSVKAATFACRKSPGALPGAGGTQRLGRLIGWARASEMILLADPSWLIKRLSWGSPMSSPNLKINNATVDEYRGKLAAGAPVAQKLAKGLFTMGPRPTSAQRFTLRRPSPAISP